MGEETKVLAGKMIDRLFKESLLVIVLVLLLGMVCWFCYSLVSNVISITEKTTLVIERNTQVIENYKRETIERITDDHSKIIDLLKDIKTEVSK